MSIGANDLALFVFTNISVSSPKAKLNVFIMIIGIGTDIVEIERIKKVVDKWGERFLNKIYTEKEITYCYQKRDFFTHLAGRFAAKEAVIKAFGGINTHPLYNKRIERLQENLSHQLIDIANIRKNIVLKRIEVCNDDFGMPFININIPSFNIEEMELFIHLTLSHEKKFAIATAIIEKQYFKNFLHT